MQDTRKLIGRATANIEALLHELYLVAGIETVTADHKKQFDELKSQIEEAQHQLADLNAQIENGRAELERMAAERKTIDRQVHDLRDEHRRLGVDIAEIRKRLIAAEAA